MFVPAAPHPLDGGGQRVLLEVRAAKTQLQRAWTLLYKGVWNLQQVQKMHRAKPNTHASF